MKPYWKRDKSSKGKEGKEVAITYDRKVGKRKNIGLSHHIYSIAEENT